MDTAAAKAFCWQGAACAVFGFAAIAKKHQFHL